MKRIIKWFRTNWSYTYDSTQSAILVGGLILLGVGIDSTLYSLFPEAKQDLQSSLIVLLIGLTMIIVMLIVAKHEEKK